MDTVPLVKEQQEDLILKEDDPEDSPIAPKRKRLRKKSSKKRLPDDDEDEDDEAEVCESTTITLENKLPMKPTVSSSSKSKTNNEEATKENESGSGNGSSHDPKKTLFTTKKAPLPSTKPSSKSTNKPSNTVTKSSSKTSTKSPNNTSKMTPNQNSIKPLSVTKKASSTSASGKRSAPTKVHPFFAKRAKTVKKKDKEVVSKNKLSDATKPSSGKMMSSTSAGKAGKLPYASVVAVFDAIEKTTKRLEIQAHLSDFFFNILCNAESSPGPTQSDLIASAYLASNTIYPSYKPNNQLGIGESLLIKAISSCTGMRPKDVKAKYNKLGDLGSVAAKCKAKQSMLMKPTPLSVHDILAAFRKIAANTKQQPKIDQIQKLLVRAKGHEAKYIIRGLQGKLRIGLAEQTILIALAHAFHRHEQQKQKHPKKSRKSDLTIYLESLKKKKTSSSSSTSEKTNTAAIERDENQRLQAADTVKEAMSVSPSWDSVIEGLLACGLKNLLSFDTKSFPKACRLVAGIPVKPMLAKPTNGITEVLDRFSKVKFTCEFKYDGERAQIHRMADGTVEIFSRNLETNTERFPDIINALPQICNLKTVNTTAAEKTEEGSSSTAVSSFILDAEVVAWDRVEKKLLPFQVLSTRSRKGTSMEDVKVQVIILAFDLLYLNGKSLLKEPLLTRRKLLRENFHTVEGKFDFAQSKDAIETEAIQEFLKASIQGNCEGLMIKTLEENATYEPSRRSLNWLKLKKDYMEGLGDSFDLVPVGAYYGKGKRTGVFGAYLLACYCAEDEVYQCITKLGTGLSDENLKKFTEEFNNPELERQAKNNTRPPDVFVKDKMPKPDVWFNPEKSPVWEIKAADLSISPVYTAAFGLADPDKGIALRFPRLVRVREDKDPSDATDAEQISQFYHDQHKA
eukprot:g1780.t1